MNRIFMIIIGLLCSFVTTALGAYIYTQLILSHLQINFTELLTGDLGGKLIAIGSLMNIPIVYLFLQKKWWDISRGIIAGLIILVIISQII